MGPYPCSIIMYLLQRWRSQNSHKLRTMKKLFTTVWTTNIKIWKTSWIYLFIKTLYLFKNLNAVQQVAQFTSELFCEAAPFQGVLIHGLWLPQKVSETLIFTFHTSYARILTLLAPTLKNGQTHTNNSSAIAEELFECVWSFWGAGA